MLDFEIVRLVLFVLSSLHQILSPLHFIDISSLWEIVTVRVSRPYVYVMVARIP